MNLNAATNQDSARRLKDLKARHGAPASSRLQQELKAFAKEGLGDWLMAIEAFVQLADARRIPYFVRGEANGSVVLYWLGLTTIDPLEFELRIETFLGYETNSKSCRLNGCLFTSQEGLTLFDGPEESERLAPLRPWINQHKMLEQIDQRFRESTDHLGENWNRIPINAELTRLDSIQNYREVPDLARLFTMGFGNERIESLADVASFIALNNAGDDARQLLAQFIWARHTPRNLAAEWQRFFQDSRGVPIFREDVARLIASLLDRNFGKCLALVNSLRRTKFAANDIYAQLQSQLELPQSELAQQVSNLVHESKSVLASKAHCLSYAELAVRDAASRNRPEQFPTCTSNSGRRQH